MPVDAPVTTANGVAEPSRLGALDDAISLLLRHCRRTETPMPRCCGEMAGGYGGMRLGVKGNACDGGHSHSRQPAPYSRLPGGRQEWIGAFNSALGHDVDLFAEPVRVNAKS